MQTESTSHGLALVTGASSGIGQAYARRLAAEGFDLVLVARRKERLRMLCDEISTSTSRHAEPHAIDLSTDEGIREAERMIENSPSLQWMVNAAGFGTRGRYANVSPEKITRMVRLHVEANARLVRTALPNMIAQRQGSIVLVSSLSAFLTTAEYVSYSATKAYLNMLVLGLRDEVRGTGVCVQALCPGLTRSEFLETEEFSDFKYDSVPAWAWMTSEQVVTESIAAMSLSERHPIFIPGRANRALMAILQAPLLGAATRALLARLGRNRKLF